MSNDHAAKMTKTAVRLRGNNLHGVDIDHLEVGWGEVPLAALLEAGR
jgi:hypothetical protein